MIITTTNAFLDWASERRLRLDHRYGPPRGLIFERQATFSISLPAEVNQRTALYRRLFDLIPAGHLWIWKRGGVWDFNDYPESGKLGRVRRAVNTMMLRLGVVPGDNALKFADHEHDLVLGIIVLWSTIAAQVCDDLFIVPDQAEFYFWFDHHDEVHVGCNTDGVAAHLSAQLGQTNGTGRSI